MVIYGHGLMGAATEVEGGTQQTTASSLCMVFAATDLRGMSTQDIAAVATALNDGTHADQVMEVLEQGLVNQVTLVRALRTTFAQMLFVDANNGNKVLVDPTNVVYYGLSQGGIFGTSVLAYDPTLTQGVLGVGAANYSMLLDRSTDWPRYRSILSAAYPDSLDDTMLLSLFQMRWDKTEGAGIVNSVLAGTPTSPQPKQLLMQIALSDNQVPNIGSYWQARSMGIPVLGPTPVTPWGLTVQQTPITTGSAIDHHGWRRAGRARDERPRARAEPEHARPHAHAARDVASDARLLYDRHAHQRGAPARASARAAPVTRLVSRTQSHASTRSTRTIVTSSRGSAASLPNPAPV